MFGLISVIKLYWRKRFCGIEIETEQKSVVRTAGQNLEITSLKSTVVIEKTSQNKLKSGHNMSRTFPADDVSYPNERKDFTKSCIGIESVESKFGNHNETRIANMERKIEELFEKIDNHYTDINRQLRETNRQKQETIKMIEMQDEKSAVLFKEIKDSIRTHDREMIGMRRRLNSADDKAHSGYNF